MGWDRNLVSGGVEVVLDGGFWDGWPGFWPRFWPCGRGATGGLEG